MQGTQTLPSRVAGRSGPRCSSEIARRQAVGVPEPQGSLQTRAMSPPALQRMPQEPVEVVALGVPVLQRMREPTMGYPNNALYPGQAVGIMC